MGQLITPYKTRSSVDLVEKILEADASGRITIIGDKISKLGYPVDVEGFDNGYNIISGKDIRSDRIKVVSAHYDGDGAYDNAGGVVVVLNIMEKLRDGNYPLDELRFAFFDLEEDYQKGSEYHLSKAENRENVVRNINIDGCGIGDKLFEVKEKYDLRCINSPNTWTELIVRSDSLPFRKYGIHSKHFATLPEDEVEGLKNNLYPKTVSEVLGIFGRDDISNISEDSLAYARDALIEEIIGGD